MNDTIEGCRVTGQIADRRQEHQRQVDRPRAAARAGRHGVPEAEPVPQVDLRQRRLRRAPARPRRRQEGDSTSIVETSLQRAGLWEEVKDRLSQPGMSLSGGQQQRLVIARAIAVSPDIILMDEPCSALDPIATAKIEELIDELQGQLLHRHRHPLDGAGGPGLAADGLLPPRQAGRDRRDRDDLHQPARYAHAGLHHRPLRLMRSDGARGE